MVFLSLSFFFVSLFIFLLSGGMGGKRLWSPTRIDHFGLGQDTVV